MFFWTPWAPLTREQVSQLADVPGLYEVKVDGRNPVPYPSGKSAMVFYGITDERKSLRIALEEDWYSPAKDAIRAQWSETHGALVFRWAATPDPKPEHDRRMRAFIERFSRFPWGNAD